MTYAFSFPAVLHVVVLCLFFRNRAPFFLILPLSQCAALFISSGSHWLFLSFWFIYWCSWFILRRLEYKRLSPGLPHSVLWGHLLLLRDVKSRLPPDVHIQVVVTIISDDYDMRVHGVFYLDLYPVQLEPFMVVLSPETIHQASTQLGKHTKAYSKYAPVVGRDSMVISNGELWRENRALFNPFFSHSRLRSFIPATIQEGKVLTQILDHAVKSSSRLHSLETILSGALTDIIGHVTFGASMQTQTSSENLKTLLSRLSWLISTSTFSSFLSVLNIGEGRLVNQMAKESSTQVRNHASDCLRSQAKQKATSSIVETLSRQCPTKLENLLDTKTNLLIENIKNIIFAGIDTSSSVLTHALYELSRNPDVLLRLREEHTCVLKNDRSASPFEATRLHSQLNQLPYTSAVIKETMRLYTPAGSTRLGEKGCHLRHQSTGLCFPTEGCMVYLAGPALHRDPTYFPMPQDFHPERFLAEGRSKFPEIPKYVYRPFEQGPRACLGQDLAMLELKVLLVMLIHKFDFEPDYRGEPSYKNCIPGYGERAYQTMFTTAKPKDGVPVVVRHRAFVEDS